MTEPERAKYIRWLDATFPVTSEQPFEPTNRTTIAEATVTGTRVSEPNVVPPPPADAALLREIADELERDESGDDPCRLPSLDHARLRALAAWVEKMDSLTKGDWVYIAALADAQQFNGDGAQYFTSNHMRVVNRMTALLTELCSAAP